MEFDPPTFASINEWGNVDFAPHNKGVTPVFFVEAVQDHGASEKEGRTVYVDKERVRIYVVGDSSTVATHPVDATMNMRRGSASKPAVISSGCRCQNGRWQRRG